MISGPRRHCRKIWSLVLLGCNPCIIRHNGLTGCHSDTRAATPEQRYRLSYNQIWCPGLETLSRQMDSGCFYWKDQTSRANITSWRLCARQQQIKLVLIIPTYGQSAAFITAKAAFSSLRGFWFLLKWERVAGLMGNCQLRGQKCTFVADICMACYYYTSVWNLICLSPVTVQMLVLKKKKWLSFKPTSFTNKVPQNTEATNQWTKTPGCLAWACLHLHFKCSEHVRNENGLEKCCLKMDSIAAAMSTKRRGLWLHRGFRKWNDSAFFSHL